MLCRRSESSAASSPSFALSLSRARLSGSLLDDASEAALRSAATLELAITLTGDDAWAAEVGRLESAADFAIARALLDGIVPSLAEPTSWATIVAPRLTERHVARSGPRTVVVEIPQQLGYGISEPETLTVTVPASALLSHRPLLASPHVRILALNSTLKVRGTLPATILVRTSICDPPWKGDWPVMSSYSSTPSAHQSTVVVWPARRIVSGARYSGVPHTVKVRSSTTFAKPKSTILR